MESNYSNRDFERYVQDNADQYRMFPSEKVWNGVHNALHTRRRWYGIGLAFLLLVTGGAVTFVMKSYPVAKKQDLTAATKPSLSQTTTTTAAESTEPKEDIRDILSIDRQTKSLITTPGASIENTDHHSLSPAYAGKQSFVIPEPVTAQDVFRDAPPPPMITQPPVKPLVNNIVHQDPAAVNRTQQLQAIVIPVQVADAPVAQATATSTRETSRKESATILEEFPYSIENVVNSYKAPPKKVSWQLFITPTISYRKLSENKSFTDNGTPNVGYPFASLSDVNSAVTHKPDIGLQLGVMGRYPITKNLKLRAGLQFNINRYDIKAYTYPAEVAVINLDGGNGSSPGSIVTWSQYRSQHGDNSNWLKNYYLSVSAPIGAELTVARNKKTSIGVAGTIQPTYVVRDRAYLISSDLKNYAEVPWLIRHVNMSTGFEAFVNYTSRNNTRWQVGPQVRYQLLSSFKNKYPVKENLFDFGVKIGVSLND